MQSRMVVMFAVSYFTSFLASTILEVVTSAKTTEAYPLLLHDVPALWRAQELKGLAILDSMASVVAHTVVEFQLSRQRENT